MVCPLGITQYGQVGTVAPSAVNFPRAVRVRTSGHFPYDPFVSGSHLFSAWVLRGWLKFGFSWRRTSRKCFRIWRNARGRITQNGEVFAVDVSVVNACALLALDTIATSLVCGNYSLSAWNIEKCALYMLQLLFRVVPALGYFDITAPLRAHRIWQPLVQEIGSTGRRLQKCICLHRNGRNSNVFHMKVVVDPKVDSRPHRDALRGAGDTWSVKLDVRGLGSILTSPTVAVHRLCARGSMVLCVELLLYLHCLLVFVENFGFFGLCSPRPLCMVLKLV